MQSTTDFSCDSLWIKKKRKKQTDQENETEVRISEGKFDSVKEFKVSQFTGLKQLSQKFQLACCHRNFKSVSNEKQELEQE